MGFLTLKRLITLICALLVALAVPSIATASGDDVIRDCAQDGDLDGDYSQDELDDANENMPSDIDEYSTCRDVIAQAREGAGGAGNAAGSPVGGSTNPTDGPSGGAGAGGSGNDVDELKSRGEGSRADDAPEATVAGEETGTDGGTITTSDQSDGLPAPLIAALIVVALAALGGGLYLLRDYLPPGITSRLPEPLRPDSQG